MSYFLRAKTTQRLSTVFLRFIDGREINLRVATEFKVLPEAWLGTIVGNQTAETTKKTKPKKNGEKERKSQGKPEKINTYLCNNIFTEQDAHVLINSLGDLRQTIMKAYSPGTAVSKEWLEGIIFKFHHPEHKAQAKDTLPETLNQFLDRYITETENGVRLTQEKKQRFSKGTIQSLKGLKFHLEKFEEENKRVVKFKDIDIDFYNELIQYFHKKNFRTNTTGKYIKAIKTIMQAAADEGKHDNMQFKLRAFKAPTNEVDTIALTKEEVDTLFNLKIDDPQMAAVRDVFLCGCYIAQRHSDYHRLTKANVRTLENGKLAISLRQQKTGTEITIPARPELVEILTRYDFTLPRLPEQYINRDIKKICRDAGITQPIEVTSQVGGFTVRNSVDKCELVTTHTARRTGATLMFLSGISSLQVSKLTGHKTEKEFLKYIRLDQKQTAEILSHAAYFNPPVMKVG